MPSQPLTSRSPIFCLIATPCCQAGKCYLKTFLTFQEEFRWHFLSNVLILSTVAIAIKSPTAGWHFQSTVKWNLTPIWFTMRLVSLALILKTLFIATKIIILLWYLVFSGEWTVRRSCDRLRSGQRPECQLSGAPWEVQLIWCHGDVTTCRNVTFWPIRPQSLSGFESDNTLVGVKKKR